MMSAWPHVGWSSMVSLVSSWAESTSRWLDYCPLKSGAAQQDNFANSMFHTKQQVSSFVMTYQQIL